MGSYRSVILPMSLTLEREGVVDKLNFTVPRYENNEISPEIATLKYHLPSIFFKSPHQAQCSTVNLPLISVNKLENITVI